MELDQMKNLWNKDKGNTPPEISLEEQMQIHSPLEMIRINMKTEFWLMIFTLPLLFYGFPTATGDYNVRVIASFQIVLSLCFIIYFYSRFVKLYKLLGKKSTNTNYDLFTLKTQLLISKEIYISYYISYIPLAFIISLIQIGFHFDKDYHMTLFAVSLLISILLICFIIKYWVHYMYGKYIKEVVNLIEELNGVEGMPIVAKNKTWFEKSQDYLMGKYGFRGNIINTVVWFVMMYFVFLACLAVVFTLIILAGVLCNLIDINAFNKAMQSLD
ncbi:hypothetical protein [Chryseobacterium sp.]|uniref:hypothetical protein n=1 Tax=Chryseobacterium sp. TaxID=1871047 RepID=UPI0038901580